MNRSTRQPAPRAIGWLLPVSLFRSLFLVLALYFAAGWASLLLYDTSPFSAGHCLRYYLLNLHVPALGGMLALWALLGHFRDFLLSRGAAPPEEDARTRRLLVRGEAVGVVLLVAFAAFLFAWVATLLPVEISDGRPSLRPSSTFLMDRISSRPTIEVTTNAHGFRDRAWNARSRDGEYRVLLVGDSMVFGSGITRQSETLSPVLDQALKEKGDREINVFNLSLNGINYTQEIDLLDRHAQTIQPDLVVMVHNPLNDLMPLLPYYVSPFASVLFLPAMLEYVSALDDWMQGHLLSDTPGSLDRFQADTNRLEDLSHRVGFDVLFAYLGGQCPPHYFRPPEKRRRLFMFTILESLRDGEDLTFENDIHPNPRGVRRLAEYLADPVSRIAVGAENWRTQDMDPLTRTFKEGCLAHRNRETIPDPPPPEPKVLRRAILPKDVGPAVLSVLGDFGLGRTVSGNWKVGDVVVRERTVDIELAGPHGRMHLVLSHPDDQPNPRFKSRSFAMTATGNHTATGAPEALQWLADTIVRLDQGGFWAEVEALER
ncbi:MAG: SGNH/GDSL hydrolase family protein [Deltaproteobacteria bacterium]|nr:SGNH/GDSL hydrolase family protein [Deltaproteobacteria bacterium]